MICQEHCEGCPYFSGKMLWMCNYGRNTSKAIPSEGQEGIEALRKKIQEIKKRIAVAKR